MSSWGDRVAGHPLIGELDGFDAALASAEPKLESADAIEAHARLRNVSEYTRQAISSSDPELIPVNVLGRVEPEVRMAREQVETFAGDGDVSRLHNANDNADTWLDELDALPMPLGSAEAAEVLVSFRRSAGQHLRNLEEQASTTRSHIEERLNEAATLAESTQESLSQLQSEIEQQQGRLDTAISTHQQQFSDAEATRAAAFQQSLTEGRAGLDAAATEGRQRLNDALADAETQLASAVTGAKERLDADLAKHGEHASAILGELGEFRDQAVALVSVIGNTGLTGDYQLLANREQGSANRWRRAAIVAAMGAAIMKGVAWIVELTRDVDFQTILVVRLSITIPLLAIAGYALAESRDHRHNERGARSMELQLASLGPYLAEFEPGDRRKLRWKAFDRFFPGQPDARRLLAEESGPEPS